MKPDMGRCLGNEMPAPLLKNATNRSILRSLNFLIAKLTHFASDVLFQLDSLEEEADQLQFGILAPVRMSRKYGASI
jgi:hypothetical protein